MFQVPYFTPPYLLLLTKGRSPLQKVSDNVRFPDLETEVKNSEDMSDSVVNPIPCRESGESNEILGEIGTPAETSGLEM